MKLNVKQILFIVCVAIATVAAIFFGGHVQTGLTSLVHVENYSSWNIADVMNKLSGTVNIVVKSSDIDYGYAGAQNIISNIDKFPFLHIINTNIVPDKIISEFAAHRGGMIDSKSRHALESGNFDMVTQNAVNRISYSMAPTMLPITQDPFLLFNGYITEMTHNSPNWVDYNGLLWQERNNVHYFMINADVENTDGAMDDVYQLYQELKDMNSDNLEIYIGGAPVHTAIMTRQSKIEIGFLSGLAILMTVFITYGLFRNFRVLIPIMLSLCAGFAGGVAAVFLFFSAPHILVFVFGTSLIGIGIDYSFHFIASTGSSDMQNVRKNVMHSFLTTCLCFMPLMFSSLDLLRQISVFTIVGMTTIYIWLNLFITKPIPMNIPNIRLPRPIAYKYRKFSILILIGLIVATLPFMCMKNDITGLYKPNTDLRVAEQTIGDLNGTKKSNMVLIRGDDIQSVLGTEEELRDTGIDIFGISTIIPSLARQESNAALIQELYGRNAKKIQSELGLNKTPKFINTPKLDISNVENLAIKSLIQKFIFDDGAYVYAIATSNQNVNRPDVLTINPSAFINNQISVLGMETYNMLVICTIVMVIVLGIIYGRRMMMYLLPPVLGGSLALCIITWCAGPISFFHLISLFIVIGVGIDYTIFHLNSRSHSELCPVLFSFLTSFIGFGLLAFTSFFLIAAMGITLGLGIGLCYLISFLLFRDTGGTDNCSPVK